MSTVSKTQKKLCKFIEKESCGFVSKSVVFVSEIGWLEVDQRGL